MRHLPDHLLAAELKHMPGNPGAERARGGWRRHFAWVVRMLPVPALPGGWAAFDERAFELRDTDRRVLDRWLDTGEAAA